MFDLIDQLSDEQRQVLILKFVFDFSNVEAAAVLEKTEGAIKSLQHRALASLQKHVRIASVAAWLSTWASSAFPARARPRSSTR